jgi:hypothetical protein
MNFFYAAPENPPDEFIPMTSGVVARTFMQLMSTMPDIKVLALSGVFFICSWLVSKVQYFMQGMLFVQIVVGGADDAESTTSGSSQRVRQEGDELAEAVKKYAAFRALEARSPIRWLFPMPELQVCTSIDASTLCNEEADGSYELNAQDDGVPIKTATVLPADGASSVIFVEGVPLFRLPLVWVRESSSPASFVDRLKHALPKQLVQSMETIAARVTGGRFDGRDQYAAGGGGRRFDGHFGGGSFDGRGLGHDERDERGAGGRRGSAADLYHLGSEDESSYSQGAVILSTFAWNESLLPRVLEDARVLAHKRRGRSCEVLKLTEIDGDLLRDSMLGRSTRQLAPIEPKRGRSSYGASSWLCWETVYAPPRKLETVFLPPTAASLLDDIDDFLRKRAWYMKRSFWYQRIYLLWGPPGNGKSSFLQALAVHHSLPLYVLQLSDGDITRELCRSALKATAKMPCVVAIEDAESCFAKCDANAKRDANASGGWGGRGGGRGNRHYRQMEMDPHSHFPVTAKEFVELLTAEDEKAPNGRILIFTTNTIEMLEPALKRLIREQGREIEFPSTSEAVRQRMWLNFYGPTAETSYGQFEVSLREVAGDHASIGVSVFQGFLMRYRDTPEEATKAEHIRTNLIQPSKHAREEGAAAGTTSSLGSGWQGLRLRLRGSRLDWLSKASLTARRLSSGGLSSSYAPELGSYPPTPMVDFERDEDELAAAAMTPLPPMRGDTAESQHPYSPGRSPGRRKAA